MLSKVSDAQGIGSKLWVLAIALSLLLSALWLRIDWTALSHGRLPDSDDMVRLAQVRDWLAGQSFTDLAQHRLGAPGGVAMHWSRIGDFGIAAWMLVLRPLLGAGRGDIGAAILWPATLFIFYLACVARLAARIAGRDHAAIALILGAFAFPAITMFVPGRIDHHGLQIILVLVIAEATLRRATLGNGAAIGVTLAASLAIGLETAPQCAVAMAVLAILWIVEGQAERLRFAAFGGALGGFTALWLLAARPDFWPAGWCDGFTPATSNATLIVAAGCAALAAATPWLKSWRSRLVAGVFAGLAAFLVARHTSSVCLTGPYGPVDPLLRRLWLDRVEEARGLFADDIGKALAFGGLALTAVLSSAVLLIRERRREWAILIAFQAAGAAVMLMQMRGAALAAALAAPTMAHLIILARKRISKPGGGALLAGTWLVSAGLAWSMAPRFVSPHDKVAVAERGADCNTATTLDQLNALPSGTIIAPIDAGAYLIGATPHRVLAAPYHRNNTGNRAAYDFWLSPPDLARGITAGWHVTYVLACPDAFGGIDLKREGPGGMAILLARRLPPAWLQPIRLIGSAGQLYRVLPLSPLQR